MGNRPGANISKENALGPISLIFWKLAVGKKPGAFISKENALSSDFVDFSGDWLWAMSLGLRFRKKIP